MASRVRTALRPVRDLLYDVLNPEEESEVVAPSVTADERRWIAEKGFTYFTSFDDLFGWTPETCRRVQKSETRLLKRANAVIGQPDTSKVMLIHDYGTGYHEYEGREPVILKDPEYTCDYLQYVSTFVYFTHYLVSVPPPAWIEVLHRNGVKALGTFLIEPQTPENERMLVREIEKGPHGEDVEYFPVARKLADLAKTIGFDGWLINIEKAFPASIWSLKLMRAFLEQLKSDTESQNREGVVVWYDSLTTTNTKAPQNALTPNNLPFLRAAGDILINYRWNPDLLHSSVALAKTQNIDPESLFFGIDVWAQNRPRNFWHPRVTWPSDTGGGTNTGLAIGELARHGVSAAPFAPAWSHQHFQSPEARKIVNQAMWLGTNLPLDITCNCKPGWFDPRDPHRTREYHRNSISEYGRQHPAGGEKYFKTAFHRGITKQADGCYLSDLSRQSVSPLPSRSGGDNVLSWELNECNNSLIVSSCVALSNQTTYGRLYDLGIEADGALRLRVRYRCLGSDISVCLALTIANKEADATRLVALEKTEEFLLETQISDIEGRITGLGVVVETGNSTYEAESVSSRLLELMEIEIIANSCSEDFSKMKSLITVV